ncbi:hypothetical protein GBF38_020771 [Nibea albiflora]|uniref:Uncharacterized protein n=1 Tax=Nibea albiflora TaxID=240163 RepID=A0ACB7FEH2_NIBAL|nr:hypothetical protein GBF38_020771 [Nibea albiflora]
MTASSRPLSPQPSTSLMTHPETLTATGWDADRVRYKGEKCFSVPVKCLLIPEEDALQLQTPPLAGSRTPSVQTAVSEDSKGDSSEVCNSPESAQLSVDDAEWRIGEPAVLETVCDAKENSALPAEHNMLHEDTFVGIIHSDFRPLTNPWDIFPPPGDTSPSSCASSESTPTHSPHDRTVAESKPDQAAVLTSTQFPVQSSKEPQQTSEQSTLPPYQPRLPSTSHAASVGSSTSSFLKTPEPFTTLSNLSPATDKHHTDPGASNEERQEKRKSGKAKRKSSVLTPEGRSGRGRGGSSDQQESSILVV